MADSAAYRRCPDIKSVVLFRVRWGRRKEAILYLPINVFGLIRGHRDISSFRLLCRAVVVDRSHCSVCVCWNTGDINGTAMAGEDDHRSKSQTTEAQNDRRFILDVL